MNIAEYIIDHLRTDVDIVMLVNNRITQGIIDPGETFPRIWLERSGRPSMSTLNVEADDLTNETFNCECIGRVAEGSDGVKDAQDIADAIRTSLDGFKGKLAGYTVKGVFVNEHDDSYQPRAIDDLNGFYIAALEIEIIY